MLNVSGSEYVVLLVLAVAEGALGYYLSESDRRNLGRTPWGLPSILWALIWFFSLLLGLILWFFAHRSEVRRAAQTPYGSVVGQPRSPASRAGLGRRLPGVPEACRRWFEGFARHATGTAAGGSRHRAPGRRRVPSGLAPRSERAVPLPLVDRLGVDVLRVLARADRGRHQSRSAHRALRLGGCRPGCGDLLMATTAPGAPTARRDTIGAGPSAPLGRRRRLPMALAVVLWVAVGAMALVAAASRRLGRSGDLRGGEYGDSVVYLPAWVIAPVVFIGRRPLLGVTALCVVVAQIAFMIPELTAAAPLPEWVASARSFRIMDANVYQGNPSMAGYAREAARFHPAVITMEEANPADARQLERSGVLDGLPYRFDVPRWDSTAYFIASAYPLEDVGVTYLYGHPLMVQLRLMLPGTPSPSGRAHRRPAALVIPGVAPPAAAHRRPRRSAGDRWTPPRRRLQRHLGEPGISRHPRHRSDRRCGCPWSAVRDDVVAEEALPSPDREDRPRPDRWRRGGRGDQDRCRPGSDHRDVMATIAVSGEAIDGVDGVGESRPGGSGDVALGDGMEADEFRGTTVGGGDSR